MKVEEKYKSVKIVSILFPIIGLIIYAVNVGKNDDLANLALKWAKKFFIIWGATILFIILIVNIVFFLGRTTTKTINSNTKTPTIEYITIPNVENMSVSEATRKLEEVGFKVTKYETISSEDISIGHIVKTEPQAGRKELTNTKITLYISMGN